MTDTILDVLHRHPNFDPRTHTDIPSIEEIYAANTMTYEQARAIQQQEKARRESENAKRHGDEEEYHANMLRLRMRQAGVPQRFVGVAANMTYDLTNGNGLYVYGRQGSGKTTLACGVLKGWMADNHGSAWFVSSSALMDELHATYSTTDTEQEVVYKYGACKLLVIDDLGKENPTDQTLMKLWQVIDKRYGAMLPTVVTTQYDPGSLVRELSRKGGEETAKAIISRLYDTCQSVTMGDVDHRRK